MGKRGKMPVCSPNWKPWKKEMYNDNFSKVAKVWFDFLCLVLILHPVIQSYSSLLIVSVLKITSIKINVFILLWFKAIISYAWMVFQFACPKLELLCWGSKLLSAFLFVTICHSSHLASCAHFQHLIRWQLIRCRSCFPSPSGLKVNIQRIDSKLTNSVHWQAVSFVNIYALFLYKM